MEETPAYMRSAARNSKVRNPGQEQALSAFLSPGNLAIGGCGQKCLCFALWPP